MIDNLYLELQNPWWQTKEKIEKDDKLLEFHRAKYRYYPKEILGLGLAPSDIHLLTGPRQTGKSTAVKLLIEKLLKREIPPRAILYYNCDALSSKKDVIDLVTAYFGLGPQKTYYLFLDEISSVSDWPYAVKWLADAGMLKKTALLLTGSSSINLKKSGEFLPGRRGKGRDLNLLPVSFSQFLALKYPEIEKVEFQPSRISFLNSQVSALTINLEQEYQKFLKSGGFLRIINKGEEPERENELYLGTLRSEIFKAGKKEENMRQVLQKIISSLGSETSYSNIAEEAELGSKNTAADYLSFLKDSFFLSEVQFFDIPQKRVRLKKNKKFYPLDPYFFWLFQGFITGNLDFSAFYPLYRSEREEGRLAEAFVASELVKAGRRFFFYKGKKEIDFYLPEERLGLEVKYQRKITGEDWRGLAEAERKIVLSKSVLEKRGEVLILPVFLWAAFAKEFLS